MGSDFPDNDVVHAGVEALPLSLDVPAAGDALQQEASRGVGDQYGIGIVCRCALDSPHVTVGLARAALLWAGYVGCFPNRCCHLRRACGQPVSRASKAGPAVVHGRE